MFETVLVPFDFSPDARHAVECARGLPGLERLILFHAVFDRRLGRPGVESEASVDYARLRLEEFERGLPRGTADVVTRAERVSGGPFSDAVNRVADEEGASLVVLGRRGRGVIETLLVGSFAADILRFGRHDVLLVHGPAGPGDVAPGPGGPCPGLFDSVMICTDFSAPEIAEICAAALPRDAPFILFHAVETGESIEEVRERCAAAKARLDEIAASIPVGRAPIRVSLRVGDAAGRILLAACEEDASLVVVASGGKRSLLHDVLGSTSAAVVRQADRPVLVLRRSPGRPGPARADSP